jgi:hypothetical protein
MPQKGVRLIPTRVGIILMRTLNVSAELVCYNNCLGMYS